ncbi:uncharacterized protein M421DRAFT_92014 [Didymella exigua CBS 183.55]|uniref:Transcription factor domain-containing protein n=1 Tax=Didymella exigua CBS 183.55 TaxID=1150837 RepID=A0A6A5RN63_9PLEO|nr:uncharacterized protein M421DRAFT_92014 [Didymella exigua CBS 183.55]KAF1928883.1 hypothetical protein M421DRAFT_92014 [Didymella exigua CBS 183.55]
MADTSNLTWSIFNGQIRNTSSTALGNVDERRSQTAQPRHEICSDDEEGVDTKDLRSSDFAREDAAYYENEEGDDGIVDLGIALGKVGTMERIGGLVQPRFTDELGQALKELPRRKSQDPNSFSAGAVEWTMPSNDYVEPSSSFFFTPGAEEITLMNYLPAKTLIDRLIAHYWQAVHVIARIVHRPSFERHYDKFWKSVASGMDPRNSFQAVVFAALLSSVVSMSKEKVLAEFGVDKQGLVDNFREATEAALSRANLLRTTKLEMLQAFFMYLVRRLVWHQICFLDLRTCEATEPRPQIRTEDYDTCLPLNIDDIDLDRAEHSDRSIDTETGRTCFTDMTTTRMRFECYDMHHYLLDASNVIDWNEIDMLFGGAETGTGNVMILPFTFPEFSATDLNDLQWPQESCATHSLTSDKWHQRSTATNCVHNAGKYRMWQNQGEQSSSAKSKGLTIQMLALLGVILLCRGCNLQNRISFGFGASESLACVDGSITPKTVRLPVCAGGNIQKRIMYDSLDTYPNGLRS